MPVKIKNSQKKHKIDTKKLKQFVCNLLEDFEVSDRELSVLFVDNKKIQELNKLYLQKDNPTDVLAFAQEASEDPDVPSLLGDIVISVEEAFIQAQKRELDFMREVALYLAHGLLHLLGYDDLKDAEAKQMSKKQNELLRRYYDSKDKK